MHALATSSRCRFKLVVWPVRAYEPEYLVTRFRNLLNWMEQARDISSLEYVCEPFHAHAPNRIIVTDDFLIEGFKMHHQSGYQISIVKYESSELQSAAREFDATFSQCGQDKDAAIEQVRKMRDKLVGPWA